MWPPLEADESRERTGERPLSAELCVCKLYRGHATTVEAILGRLSVGWGYVVGPLARSPCAPCESRVLAISGFWITIVAAEFWTLLRGGSRVLRRWLTPLGLPLGHMPGRLSPGARFGGLNRAPSRHG